MKWQIIKPSWGSYHLKVTNHQGIVILGGSGKSEIIIELVREGAQALVLGVVNAKKQNNLELKVVTVHQKPNTHAETMIHGLVADQAQAQIKGLIQIKKKAHWVTDFLTERVLLLSDQAKAIAEPELEIAADEVRASHAATVSSLNQEQLFYLMSRGLSRKQAQDQIVDGFLGAVLARIGDGKIKHKICLMLQR